MEVRDWQREEESEEWEVDEVERVRRMMRTRRQSSRRREMNEWRVKRRRKGRCSCVVAEEVSGL